jgi:alkylated DNA repair dioxygenase AlkB
MQASQGDLFGGSVGPPGFFYEEHVVSAADEQRLMRDFATLPLQPFAFHGFLGNRRTASFGARYDYDARGLQDAEPIPDFLEALKVTAAEVASVPRADLRHALVTEYSPGAGIGWHRDKAVFGKVIAFSFGSSAILRFRRKHNSLWERMSITVQPRSVYVLSGPARHDWQHSIPVQKTLRYSVTFRTLEPSALRSLTEVQAE